MALTTSLSHHACVRVCAGVRACTRENERSGRYTLKLRIPEGQAGARHSWQGPISHFGVRTTVSASSPGQPAASVHYRLQQSQSEDAPYLLQPVTFGATAMGACCAALCSTITTKAHRKQRQPEGWRCAAPRSEGGAGLPPQYWAVVTRIHVRGHGAAASALTSTTVMSTAPSACAC